jgi:hypothetical protein
MALSFSSNVALRTKTSQTADAQMLTRMGRAERGAD